MLVLNNTVFQTANRLCRGLLFVLFIHLTGPDLCTSATETLCPRNSLCINTLGSYSCVCQHGHYDVSSFIKPPVASHPACNGEAHIQRNRASLQVKGLFR